MVQPGTFSPSIFFLTGTYIIIPTLVVIYYISQYYGHQKPFPHCWISKVAQHYPQFIFFRFATISGAVFLILGWLSNHFYLRSVAKQHVFDLKKYHPQVGMILGIMGGLLLMGNTATIDTGRMNTKWHTTCASNFFIFTVIAQAYNTYICTVIHSKTGALSQPNIYFKYFLLVLLVVQGILSFSNGFWEDYAVLAPNSRGQFLEWSLTVTIIMGFYSMGLDCRKFKFVYQISSERGDELLEVDMK